MGTLDPGELADRIAKIREFSESEARSEVVNICCNGGFSRAQMSEPEACGKVIDAYEGAGATHLIPRFEGESVPEMIDLMGEFSEKVMSSY
jgi:hypothetical protein